MYKVLIIVEAAGNGVSTQLTEFTERWLADQCVNSVNNNHVASGVEGIIVRAVPLY